jgi:asparagine synthase (glutamine-hydrolysing)
VLLREAARPLLPPAVVDRPKQGFLAPMGSWMRRELREIVADALSRETTERRGLFDPVAVDGLHRRFQEDPRTPYFKPWVLAALELWQRRYLDHAPVGEPAPCAAEVLT